MAGKGKEVPPEAGSDPSVQALHSSVESLESKVSTLSMDLQKVLSALAEIQKGADESSHPPRGGNRAHTRRRDQGFARQDNYSEQKAHRRVPPHFMESDTDEDLEELAFGDIPQRRNRHIPQQNLDYKLKFNIPYFDGKMHIEDCLDWIKAVETFFECMEIEEEKKVKLVAYRLRGGAAAWWEQTQSHRRRQQKLPIRSWNRMRRLIRERFLPLDYDQMLYQQYQSCRQGNRSVSDYTDEFYRRNASVDLQESERHQVARYLGGLKEVIKEQLSLKSIWKLNDAVNLALKAEQNKRRSPQRGDFYKRNSGEMGPFKSPSQFYKGSTSEIPPSPANIGSTPTSNPSRQAIQNTKSVSPNNPYSIEMERKIFHQLSVHLMKQIIIDDRSFSKSSINASYEGYLKIKANNDSTKSMEPTIPSALNDKVEPTKADHGIFASLKEPLENSFEHFFGCVPTSRLMHIEGDIKASGEAYNERNICFSLHAVHTFNTLSKPLLFSTVATTLADGTTPKKENSVSPLKFGSKVSAYNDSYDTNPTSTRISSRLTDGSLVAASSNTGNGAPTIQFGSGNSTSYSFTSLPAVSSSIGIFSSFYLYSEANGVFGVSTSSILDGLTLQFAQSLADYIPVKNLKLMSYLVGYQEHYSIIVLHKQDSIQSIYILPAVVEDMQGFELWSDSKKGNSNCILGAGNKEAFKSSMSAFISSRQECLYSPALAQDFEPEQANIFYKKVMAPSFQDCWKRLLSQIVSDLVQKQLMRCGYNTYVVPSIIPKKGGSGMRNIQNSSRVLFEAEEN